MNCSLRPIEHDYLFLGRKKSFHDKQEDKDKLVDEDCGLWKIVDVKEENIPIVKIINVDNDTANTEEIEEADYSIESFEAESAEVDKEEIEETTVKQIENNLFQTIDMEEVIPNEEEKSSNELFEEESVAKKETAEGEEDTKKEENINSSGWSGPRAIVRLGLGLERTDEDETLSICPESGANETTIEVDINEEFHQKEEEETIKEDDQAKEKGKQVERNMDEETNQEKENNVSNDVIEDGVMQEQEEQMQEEQEEKKQEQEQKEQEQKQEKSSLKDNISVEPELSRENGISNIEEKDSKETTTISEVKEKEKGEHSEMHEDKKEVIDINLPFIAGWDPEMKKRIKLIPKGWQLITV